MRIERSPLRFFKFLDHFAGKPGADQTSPGRDTVPNLRGKNRPRDSGISRDKMDFMPEQIRFHFFWIGMERLHFEPVGQKTNTTAIRPDR